MARKPIDDIPRSGVEYSAWYNFNKVSPCEFPDFIKTVGLKPNQASRLVVIDKSLPKTLQNIQWGNYIPKIGDKVTFKFAEGTPYGAVFGKLIFDEPYNYKVWQVTCMDCWGVSYQPFPKPGQTPVCGLCSASPAIHKTDRQRRQAKLATLNFIRRTLATNEMSERVLFDKWEEDKARRKREKMLSRHEQELENLDRKLAKEKQERLASYNLLNLKEEK